MRLKGQEAFVWGACCVRLFPETLGFQFGNLERLEKIIRRHLSFGGYLKKRVPAGSSGDLNMSLTPKYSENSMI
jgi:hypothetical protein